MDLVLFSIKNYFSMCIMRHHKMNPETSITKILIEDGLL
jgi:hypothetical protein